MGPDLRALAPGGAGFSSFYSQPAAELAVARLKAQQTCGVPHPSLFLRKVGYHDRAR